MRHLLLGFLVILTLMPVMACAMSCCPMQVEASQSIKMPCHSNNDSAKTQAIMIMADCMGVDLFSADLTDDIPQASNIILDYVSFVWADLNDFKNIDYLQNNSIRAPPELVNKFTRHTPVILTTSRIRV